MPTQPRLIQQIRVASPCGQAWDAMEGDDRSRFCRTCSKNVYNLSAMTTDEAEALVREKEGELCVRFYQRRDGTALTSNCPVGFRQMRRALLWQCTALTAVFAIIPGASAAMQEAKWKTWAIWDREPFYSYALKWGIRYPPAIAGAIAIAPPPVPPPPPQSR